MSTSSLPIRLLVFAAASRTDALSESSHCMKVTLTSGLVSWISLMTGSTFVQLRPASRSCWDWHLQESSHFGADAVFARTSDEDWDQGKSMSDFWDHEHKTDLAGCVTPQSLDYVCSGRFNVETCHDPSRSWHAIWRLRDRDVFQGILVAECEPYWMPARAKWYNRLNYGHASITVTPIPSVSVISLLRPNEVQQRPASAGSAFQVPFDQKSCRLRKNTLQARQAVCEQVSAE